MIPVAEIFGPTIQGEGPNVGIKTIFVRVCGCDFNCSWCDSKFAWKANENVVRYSSQELAQLLVKKCKDLYAYNVVLTGGNPCLYDFGEVIDILHENNISVDVETQGSKLPSWLRMVDTLVISPKAPSSHQKDVYDNIKDFLFNTAMDYRNNYKIAIKIPVFDDLDFEFAVKYYNLIQEFWEECNYINVDLYLSVGNTDTTSSGSISERVLKDYEKLIDKVMKCAMRRVYVLPQVHTLVWGNRQGV